MAFYDPLKNVMLRMMGFGAPAKKGIDLHKTLSLPEMMGELGVSNVTVLGSYQQEENPDVLAPDTYLYMQQNDGTVRSIVRLFTMPIVASDISIVPAKGDKGEADFIRSVFFNSPNQGGMSTPLPLVIADMCRAIPEGFRLYEKVPQIIDNGDHKGKIGWKKLAPRDAITVKLRSDANGGFNGAVQKVSPLATEVVLPPEKCMLYTFQKEKHPLYGESILRTAYYHYDKKHKLYYLAHKKAEIDAVGLKILKVTTPNLNEEQIKAAENAIENIGANTRLTLPQGIELDIDRSPTGYDVMNLINHHDGQMKISALTQITSMGTGDKYAYTYGKGFTQQGDYLNQAVESILRTMEYTINQWAINPLIDWNFNSKAYPQLRFTSMTSEVQIMMNQIFYAMIRSKDFILPGGFQNEILDHFAGLLGIDYKTATEIDAIKSFETGKRTMANALKIPAPATDQQMKAALMKKFLELKDDGEVLEKFEVMGKDLCLSHYSELKK
jgi:hypothetical protein